MPRKPYAHKKESRRPSMKGKKMSIKKPKALHEGMGKNIGQIITEVASKKRKGEI